MKIAIMQPTFNPWLGYIYMIQKVDAFVFLDNVQFERRSWQNRNKIKLQNQIFMLNLITKKAPQKTSLMDIFLDNDQKWKEKFLKTIYHAYSKSVNFKKYYHFLEQNLHQEKKLIDFNINLILKICKDLDIQTPIYRSSTMNITLEKKERLILNICKILKTRHYLSPEGSKNYLQSTKKIFQDENINIEYFNFIHPTYFQQGDTFIPYLGSLDFLFNEKNPLSKFKEIIKENESFI
ncbi:MULTISPECIES: WbqC family protein [Campylobacter]|uniref:WbqC family protein n=1 Tax=Campylobacter TaxID=194 RepID=UPI001EC45974|nr:WbqC family protein [Campylobacter sp. W0014]